MNWWCENTGEHVNCIQKSLFKKNGFIRNFHINGNDALTKKRGSIVYPCILQVSRSLELLVYLLSRSLVAINSS